MNGKEVKSHIGSVSDIRKITNAMYLIASTKLRKARTEYENTKPFFDGIKKTVDRICGDKKAHSSPYFQQKEGKIGVLILTADRGLAGAFNHGILKKTDAIVEGKECVLFPVGKTAQRYYGKKKPEALFPGFEFSAEGTVLEEAREIADILFGCYQSGVISQIRVVFSDVGNGSKVTENTLLPLTKHNGEETEFFPNIHSVLDGAVPDYLTGYIYGAMITTFCSEQNARMVAMDAANRNAQKMLSELSVQYDRIRQNAITQEIIEISSGSRWQTSKKGDKKP